ncbi:MAG: hypothetical protein AAF975_03525 [Spirochaetota bacterium]
MKNIIATWMYSSPEGENIFHAQVGPHSAKQKTRNLYWRCVFLLFESSSRHNPNAEHILLLNKKPPAQIDGIDTARLMEQYRIQAVPFPTITKSPKDYYKAWNSQFILLDAIDYLKGHAAADDRVFILDSDIIFNRPISDELIARLDSHKALLYSLHLGDWSENGLNSKELLEISQEIYSGFPEEEFVYSGGEIICCLGSELRPIAELARRSYALCLERHQQGLKKFNEEAHLLSSVYHMRGYRPYTANPYFRRLWTDRSIYSNLEGDEDQLIFWHLPAEKKYGFRKVFRSYRLRSGSYQLTKTDFIHAYRIEETLASKVFRLLMQYVLRPVRTWSASCHKRLSALAR